MASQTRDATSDPDTASSGPVFQCTVERAVSAEGVGVHSGLNARFSLEPAEPDAGITFIRTDLAGRPEIEVRPENVDPESLARQTVLRNAGSDASVQTVEHLLSACAGLGVDNLRVLIDGPEMPIFDGSALPFVELLRSAGALAQDSPRRFWRLRKSVALVSDKADVIAVPADRARLTFFAEFRDKGLADEHVTFEPEAEDYASEIAPARTFAFYDQVEAMREAGLIKGGTLDCAIVLKDGLPMDTSFRLPNELARHKLLDLMGDLAVLGRPLRAMISARASGHAVHYEFIRRLAPELIDD